MGAVTVPGAMHRIHSSSGFVGTKPVPPSVNALRAESIVKGPRSAAPNDPKPGPWNVASPQFFSKARMQVGDVAVPHQSLRVFGDEVEVDKRQHLNGTNSTPQAVHDIDIIVEEQRMHVSNAQFRWPCYIVVARPDAVRQFHLVAVSLAPLNRTQHVASVVERTRGSEYANRAALRQRASKSSGSHYLTPISFARVATSWSSSHALAC